MKDVSNPYRKAFVDVLTPFQIGIVTIPVFDNQVNPQVTLPTYRSAQSYIIILDQAETEVTNNDCTLDQNAVLSLDIVTKFTGSAINTFTVNEIANQVSETVYANLLDTFNASNAGIKAQDINTFRRTFPPEQGASLTVVRKRITFTSRTYQTI